MKEDILKEEYKFAEIEILRFDRSDVITTSGEGDEVSSDMSNSGWTQW